VVFFLTTMTFTYLSAQQHTKPKESVVLEAPVTPAPTAPGTAAPTPAQ
jgi:hypothetical protein